MSKLTLLPSDSPLLRQVCSPVDNQEGISIAQDLLKFISNLPGAFAIAAPQVGIMKNLFVFSSGLVFINPVIISHSNLKTLPSSFSPPIIWSGEGCLSFPGLRVRIPRWEKVNVEYTDELGLRVKKNFKGLESIAIQHEYGHLIGDTIDQY